MTWLVTGSFGGVLKAPVPRAIMPLEALPTALLTEINALLLFSLWFGGLQYIVFVLLLLWRYQSENAYFWGRLTLFLPMLFVPFCAAGLWLAAPSVSPVYTSLMAIPLGYFYVILAWLFTWLALKAGVVVDRM